MGFCVPLQRHEKRRHWVWLLNIHLHFPLYGHNMLGLINFSQRWSSAHHLLWDNHICMPLRIIPLLLKLLSYRSQIWKTFKWHRSPLKPNRYFCSISTVQAWFGQRKRWAGCFVYLLACFSRFVEMDLNFVIICLLPGHYVEQKHFPHPHQIRNSTCFVWDPAQEPSRLILPFSYLLMCEYYIYIYISQNMAVCKEPSSHSKFRREILRQSLAI